MTAHNDNLLVPLQVFRFQVDFAETPLGSGDKGSAVKLCSGAFSECTGLEATMEPKVINEGGRNYGPVQRAGPVVFGTVMLKRGITSTQHLWQWFKLVGGGGYAHRLLVTITQFDTAGKGVFSWRLLRAMPVKFKAADLNASAVEVGVEELHLVHEGLEQAAAAVASLQPRAEAS